MGAEYPLEYVSSTAYGLVGFIEQHGWISDQVEPRALSRNKHFPRSLRSAGQAANQPTGSSYCVLYDTP